MKVILILILLIVGFRFVVPMDSPAEIEYKQAKREYLALKETLSRRAVGNYD